MAVLKFKCRCCNSYHDINRTVPTGFSGWSYPGMEWSDFTDDVPPLTQERWRITEEVKKIGSDVIPKTGDVRTVRVMLPFEEEIGSEFYMDYKPVSAVSKPGCSANQLRYERAAHAADDKFIGFIGRNTVKSVRQAHFNSVFKPGFTTKARGWGLGLSLAKRIVEEYHKGKIFVKSSEVGKGTTFRIELPKGQ